MSSAALHAGLADAWALNRPDLGELGRPHVVVALPSFSLAPTIMRHYAARIPALEHRYLLSALMLARIPTSNLVFICTQQPDDVVIDHYVDLAGDPTVRDRLHVVVVPDDTPRPIAAKLLDRPDLIGLVRRVIDGRPAFLEPWNVTEHEVDVAAAIGIPVNGTSPDLWHLGFKSAGRQLFTQLAVPVPEGAADVHSIDEAAMVIERMRERLPQLPAVVLKHDDSGAGDGNAVIGLVRADGTPLGNAEVRTSLETLPEWYRADLLLGAVVEELVTGPGVTSPSAQLDIKPHGEVEVLSTHEQVLGGANGQVYLGCRFPADPGYAGQLARQAQKVGVELARFGARGRVGLDFMARPLKGGGVETLALEINLRKGGTTHPFTALRCLVPGRYDAETVRWVTADGKPRYYSATDNLQRDSWLGLSVPDVLAAVQAAGLSFDPQRGTGVVLHMVSCLAVDGRLGVIAIATSPAEADALVAATERVVDDVRVPARRV
ncbi:MAG: peptide ligase PGM1-related protein [Nocardioidaceae bacterium]